MIELPWPPKELNPNARVHWSKKSAAAKKYRAACYLITKASGMRAPDGDIRLIIEFVPPDARRRDDDNCLSSMKSGRDGLADALGIDDSRFVTQLSISKETVKGGCVRVEIEPLPRPSARNEEGEGR